MSEDGNLTCVVNIEWSNKQGVLQRKVSYKKACLRLIRNGIRNIFIEVSAEKTAPVKLELKGISVHKKFMNEGKASIKFQPLACTMYLSNAPPGQLLTFLRTIFVKMTGEKDNPNANTSMRTQLLTGQRQQFEEISPVTNAEVNKALLKVSKSTDTTPSPFASKKRKIERIEGNKAPAAKRLYTASPASTEPLDLEQKDVLDGCLAGYNVFFTGSAGTGKSYLLKRIIGALPPDVTTATASTGVAACHIGGITLHQFAGIGLGESSLERCVDLASKQPAIGVWRKCKHLVIDEISMVDADYFEKIEEVARKVRRNEKPFGGIQLILCGDFFQLPPIGSVDDNVTETLSSTSKQKVERDGILATRLCSHTKDADVINETKLKELPGQCKVFVAQDSVPGLENMLEQRMSLPGKLELKVGAQVMLLKNINVSTGLVNGARGVIRDFREGLPLVQFKNRKEYLAKHEKWVVKTAGGGSVVRKQVPLKLAWAFSIHKSQGLTLDCVEMSLGRVFEAGQAYVALSRAQSLESLRVLDFKASQVWANPVVLDFYRNLEHLRIIPLGPTSKVNIAKEVKRKLTKGAKSKLFDAPLVTIC